MRFFKSLLWCSGLVYLGLCGVLFLGQRSLLYVPRILTTEQAEKEAKAMGWKPWSDGQREILGWQARVPRGADEPRWVLFHGNGGDAFFQQQIVQAFRETPETQGHGLYVVEYPGYGAQPGHPSESSLMRRALAAVEVLERESAGPIYLIGESLGTGVACGVAGQKPTIAGLLLLMPFDRLGAVAEFHYSLFPTKWLLQDRFDSETHLQKYSGGVVIVTGQNDEIIPAQLGRRLYDNFKGRKWYWEQPEVGHNVAERSSRVLWWNQAIRFLLYRS
jgi:uncharacterized protein